MTNKNKTKTFVICSNFPFKLIDRKTKTLNVTKLTNRKQTTETKIKERQKVNKPIRFVCCFQNFLVPI